MKFYWPPLLWAALIVVIYVQMWWSMFGLRIHTDWTFLGFLVVLSQPVAFYMMAAVVLPEDVEAAGVDLRAYYESQQSWLYGFLLATVLLSLLKEEILEGRLPERGNLVFHLLLIAASVSALLVRHPRFHQFLAITSAIGIAVYIGALFTRLH